ncbi:MAG: hypothetical protein ACLPSW_07755 [Roseiarcus sp.]
MTWTKCASLIAAGFGAVGTFILFKYSYTVEPLQGSPFGGPILDAHNEIIRAKNAIRIRWQKCGLVLLFVSFVVQVVAALE